MQMPTGKTRLMGQGRSKLPGVGVTRNRVAPGVPGSVLYLPGHPPGGATIYDFSGYGNHGAITGATWTRLPSGLWWQTFATGNLVSVADAASIQNLTDWTAIFWVRNTAESIYFNQILNKKANVLGIGLVEAPTPAAIRVFRNYSDGVVLSQSNEQLTINVPTCVAVTLLNKTMYIYFDGVEATYSIQTSRTGTISTDIGGDLIIGNRSDILRPWKGQIGLSLMVSPSMTVAQILSWYNQTRYLFGV